MDIKALAAFLRAANQDTYANKQAKRSHSIRLNSKDYHFEQDGLTYHDTYFGARDFIGSEIIYEGSTPVWGANYFGYILEDDISENAVYDFLRAALMNQIDPSILPVRGPALYQRENCV